LEIDTYIKEFKSLIDLIRKEDDDFSPTILSTNRLKVIDMLEISKRFVPDHIGYIENSLIRVHRRIVICDDMVDLLTQILGWATINEESLIKSLRQTIEQKDQEISQLNTRILALETTLKDQEKESNQLKKWK
jgi:hypothetical protein